MPEHTETRQTEQLTDLQRARRDTLWALYMEWRTHARHAETIRTTVNSYTLIAASAITALITLDKKIDRADLPLTLLLILIGLSGLLIAASYTDRYHRNRERAAEVLRSLNNTYFLSTPQSPLQLKGVADLRHYNNSFYRMIRSTTSAHWLWLAFPALALALGTIMCIDAILNS